MTALLYPYIEWTDEIGAAKLTCFALTLQNWTPDQWEYGDAQVSVGTGRRFHFSYRTDHVAYFEFPNIANTETVLAMRLKSWLTRGGECVITTHDSESHVYTVILAPAQSGGVGDPPALTFTDNTELEYMLAMTVKNVDTPTPRPMPYTPVKHARVAGLTISPDPLSMPYPGGTGTVTVYVHDGDGNPVAGVAVSATSDDPAAFTVSASATTNGSGNATFTVTPHAGGTGGLHFSGGGQTGESTVTVTTGVYGIVGIDPILWLKAETENATGDGLDVSTWHDSSIHGWDMTPLAGAGGPGKWDAAKQAIRFLSASQEAYQSSAFNSLASGVAGFSLFIVGQEASNGGCVMSSPTGDFWEGYTSAGRYRMDLGGFGYDSYFTFGDTAEHVHETRFDGTGATNADKLKQLLDGTLESATQYGMPTSLTSGPGMVVGHGTGLTYYNGWVWEILMFGVRLTDAQCDSVTAQLKTKYGL